MGKSLIQQKRGKGSPRYIAPSHRWAGESKYRSDTSLQGKIIEFVDCSGHSAPLARIRYTDGEECLLVAVEGLSIGDVVGSQGADGSTMMLREIPEGTLVCNIELQPGDGGKFVRAGGTFAKVL